MSYCIIITIIIITLLLKTEVHSMKVSVIECDVYDCEYVWKMQKYNFIKKKKQSPHFSLNKVWPIEMGQWDW
jgi:hypothetical protein